MLAMLDSDDGISMLPVPAREVRWPLIWRRREWCSAKLEN